MSTYRERVEALDFKSRPGEQGDWYTLGFEECQWAAADIAAEADATEAQLRAALPVWRPIETAPKNGKSILLSWRTCPEAMRGSYSVDEEFDSKPSALRSLREGWKNDGDQCIPKNQKDCTGWQPLPLTPEALAQQHKEPSK